MVSVILVILLAQTLKEWNSVEVGSWDKEPKNLKIYREFKVEKVFRVTIKKSFGKDSIGSMSGL
jgi:hypothetical protein